MTIDKNNPNIQKMIWEIKRRELKGGISPCGERIAVALPGKKHLTVWATASGKKIAEIPLPKGEKFFKACFSPQNKRIALWSYTKEEDSAVLWDMDTQKFSTIPQYYKHLQSIDFSPDETFVATRSYTDNSYHPYTDAECYLENGVVIWNTVTGRTWRETYGYLGWWDPGNEDEKEYNHIRKVVFSPDSKMVTLTLISGIKRWSLPSFEEISDGRE